MSQVTINDVAAEAGLSPSTVSRILRGVKTHVYSAPTIERVYEIARRRGYRPNAAARVLSQGTQTMIGMSVQFTEHPYLNRFMVAVHQELLEHEYDPVLLDSNQLSSETTKAPFPPPHMLAGLISMGVDLQTGWPQPYAMLAEHTPIVAIHPVCEAAAAWVDVVQVNFRQAYSQAVDYLTGLGHRNIAFLGILENCLPGDARKLDAWVHAMEQRGLRSDFRIPWTVGAGADPEPPAAAGGFRDFIYTPASRQALVNVVEQLTSFPERVTALICVSDEVALVLQSYLQARGWQLPRDLAIVGYDGISLGEQVYPSLTTIMPDHRRMAQEAVQLLLSRIRQPGEAEPRTPRQIFIDAQLTLRESSGPPAP